MDAEYILKIILKARDDMAAVLKKARAELSAFGKDARKMDGDLEKLGNRMTSVNQRFGNMTKKLEDWRAALRGAVDDIGDTSKAADALNEKTEKGTQIVEKNAKAVQNLTDEHQELVITQGRLRREFAEGNITSAEFVDGLNRVSKALNGLAGKAKVGSDIQRDIASSARFAKKIANEVVEAEKAAAAERVKIANDLRRAREKAAQESAAAERAEAEATRKKVAAEERGKAEDVKAALAEQNKAREQAAAARRREAQAEEKLRQQQRATNREADKATKDYIKFRSHLRAGEVDTDNARAALARFAKDFARLGNEYDRNSNAARHFGFLQQEIRKELAGMARDEARAERQSDQFTQSTQRSARALREKERASGGLIGALEQVGKTIAGTGDNVASLDNRLRGMIVLAVLAFAEQLNSILIGLGGQLVAVAGSAIQAGGAIAGGLTAGIMEALPFLGIFVAAMFRVKGVMDALKASDALQQQQFQRGAKQTKQNADAADSLANANDGVRTALQGVRDAHRRVDEAIRSVDDAQAGLTVTRRAARREMEDLILAEERATRAARDSVLSQKEAQEQLRVLIQGGATQLEVQQAQAAVNEAAVDVQDSRRERGRARADVRNAQSGGPGSPSADIARSVRAVTDAKRGVADARRGVEDAERSVDRARRAVTRARRQALEVTADTFSAATKLQYLLAQLSPAERRLYEAGTRMQSFFRREFTSVTDAVVGSMARTVNRLTDVLSSRKVMNAARGLSSTLAKEMDRFTDAFSSPKMVNQFIRIGNQGRRNLGPLNSILINLGKTFANIAEAAGPALNRFLRWIAQLSDKMVAFTDKGLKTGKLTDFFNRGESHLRSWLKLFGAIIKLFFTLADVAAPSGKRSVDDLTGSVKDATKYIEDNREKVAEFFEKTRKVTNEVGRVLKELGREMLRSFNPDSAQKFGEFLRRVVIPALGAAMRAIGVLSRAMLTLFEIPLVADLAKVGIAMLIFSKVVTGMSGVIGGAATQFAHFFKLLAAGPVAMGRLGRSMSAFNGAQHQAIRGNKAYNAALAAGKTQQQASAAAAAASTTRFGRLTPVMTRAGTAVTKFGTAMKAAMAFMIGPWGLAIAAVVIGVTLLLKKFGFLDDIGRAFKKAFQGFKDALKGPLQELDKALGGTGKNTEKLREVMNKVGLAVAKFFRGAIITAIQNFFKILGAGIGGVIRVVAGVVNIVRGFIELFDSDTRGKGISRIKEGLGQLVKGFLGIGEAILRGILAPFGKLGDKLVGFFKKAWNQIKDFLGISSPSKKGKGLGESIVDGVKNGIKDVVSTITSPFRKAWRAVVNFVRDWPDNFARNIRTLRRRAGQLFDDVVDAIKGPFRTLGRFFANRWDSLINSITKLPGRISRAARGMWDGIKDAFKDAINYIIRKWNDLEFEIDLPGRDPEKIGTPDIDEWKRRGGPVGGGFGGGDRVRLMAEAGEHVWTKEEVAAAGGHGIMFLLAASEPGSDRILAALAP